MVVGTFHVIGRKYAEYTNSQPHAYNTLQTIMGVAHFYCYALYLVEDYNSSYMSCLKSVLRFTT